MKTHLAKASRKYAPALWWPCLSPYYDWALALTVPKNALLEALREALATELASRPGPFRIMEMGCATAWLSGGLAEAFQAEFPQASFVGYDADPGMVRRAKTKYEGLTNLVLENQVLPHVQDQKTYQALLASLFFHQLPNETKAEVLLWAKERLAPKGTLWVIDFDKGSSPWARFGKYCVDHLTTFQTARPMFDGGFPLLATSAGFRLRHLCSWPTVYGRLSFWELRV